MYQAVKIGLKLDLAAIAFFLKKAHDSLANFEAVKICLLKLFFGLKKAGGVLFFIKKRKLIYKPTKKQHRNHCVVWHCFAFYKGKAFYWVLKTFFKFF